MKKYLVIREYLDQNITPSVYAEIDDYESANKLASHIEDYRTKERMEEEFSRIKEIFRNNPHAEMLEEGDRHFKVKVGRVTFEYYITEREI